jgi:hypothetical protein
MPMGAMNVPVQQHQYSTLMRRKGLRKKKKRKEREWERAGLPLCFSAANMKIVKTSSAVSIISMNSPCTTVVPPPRLVCAARGPGNIQLTRAAAVKLPRICTTKSRKPRSHGRAPIRHIPNVTAGLNRPPLIRKNTHALTAREKPNERAMYWSCCGLAPVSSTVKPADDRIIFAVWQPESAKKRKRTVPTYSPHMAMKWLRMPSGILCEKGRRRSSGLPAWVGSAALVNGRARAAARLSEFATIWRDEDDGD